MFRRVNGHAEVFGVCGGFAYFIGVPTWIIRVLVVVLVLSSVGGVGLGYFLLGIFVPKWEQDPEDYEDVCE